MQEFNTSSLMKLHYCTRTKWVLFIFIIGIIVFGSCKKEEDDDPVDMSENAYNCLGYGYDYFDEYAKPDLVKTLPVFDQNMLEEKAYVYYNRNEVTNVSLISGDELSSYRNAFSEQAGVSCKYEGFTATIKANFSEESYSLSGYSFATYRSYSLKRKIGINANVSVDDLKECLTSSAKTAIDNLEAKKLFNQYGTHVIAAFKLGGTLDFHFAAKASEFQSSTSIGVLAEVGFQTEVYGASASSNTQVSEEISEKRSQVSMSLEATGGNSTYGAAIAVDRDNSENYNDWAASFDDENTWMLFDFEKLIPIWELASTEERQNELETAFETWAEDKAELEAAATNTLKVKTCYLYNPVGGVGTSAEWLWRISAGLNGTNKKITENTTSASNIDCFEGKYINFYNPVNNSGSYDDKFKQVAFEYIPRTGLQLKITPELDEHQNADLGALSNQTFGNATDGPFIYFTYNGTSWGGESLEGGCTAAIPDKVIVTEKGDGYINFEIQLRENNGEWNAEDYVIIKMSLEWE